MKNILSSLSPKMAISIWGIFGGLTLILIAGEEHNAKAVIPIYSLTFILSILTVKINSTKNYFKSLFTAIFLTFLVTLFIDYIYLITVINPALLRMPLFGHTWRVISMIAIGAIISLTFTYITKTIKEMMMK